MSNCTVADYYNENAVELVKRYESVTFEDVHSSIIKYLPAPPCSVLDIGSGSGRDADWFAKRNYNVTAIDASLKMLELAKRIHASENIKWVNDSLPLLKNIQGTYQLIFMSAILMHLSLFDIERAIKRVTELCNGNSLIITSIKIDKTVPVDVREYFSSGKFKNVCRELRLVCIFENNEADIFERENTLWLRYVLRVR